MSKELAKNYTKLSAYIERYATRSLAVNEAIKDTGCRLLSNAVLVSEQFTEGKATQEELVNKSRKFLKYINRYLSRAWSLEGALSQGNKILEKIQLEHARLESSDTK